MEKAKDERYQIKLRGAPHPNHVIEASYLDYERRVSPLGVTLTAGALVTIALHEQRSAEHDEIEIARRVIETSEAPPVPFSVSLPGGGIDPDATYTVDAWISAGSRPWTSRPPRRGRSRWKSRTMERPGSPTLQRSR